MSSHINATPVPSTRAVGTLRAATTALTAAWVESTIVTTHGFRWLQLFVKYDAVASMTDGYAVIVPLLSTVAHDGTAPVIGDDSWFAVPYVDSGPTDAVLAGSVPSGFDMTVTPEFRELKTGGRVYRTFANDAVSDKYRFALDDPFYVGNVGWFCTIQRQLGDVTNFGKLGLTYTLAM